MDYRKIYDNFLTTEEFMDEVEALGFRILTDRNYNQLRIVEYFEEEYEGETIIATVDTSKKYKALIYWDSLYNLRFIDEYEELLDDRIIKVVDKLYALLYWYGITPIEYREGKLQNRKKESFKIDYSKIYDDFLTTEEFRKEVETLGFEILTDIGRGEPRIALPHEKDNEKRVLIAKVRDCYKYKVLIYWQNFFKLMTEDEEDTIKLIDKLYTLLYRYGITPEEYKKGEF